MSKTPFIADQKVHFQQAQFLNGGHGVLGNNSLIIAGKGYIAAHRLGCDHHAGSVGRGVPGHTLQTHSSIDQGANPFIAVIHFL